jgi:hypothetical protein
MQTSHMHCQGNKKEQFLFRKLNFHKYIHTKQFVEGLFAAVVVYYLKNYSLQ